jgi:hypothetical protein
MTRDIDRQVRRLEAVASRWDIISDAERFDYMQLLRTTQNDLASAIRQELQRYNQGQFPQRDTPQIRGQSARYIDMYESLRRQYAGRVPFDVAPLRIEDRAFIDAQIREFERSFGRAANNLATEINDKMQLRRDLERQYRTLLGQDEEAIRRGLETLNPRVTLLDIGSENARVAQRRIVEEVRQGLDQGSDYRKVWRNVSRQVKSIYPDNNFIFQDRDGNPRQMNTNHYTNMWVRDMQTLAQSETTKAYMDAGGQDLVIVQGGVTDNKICDPFSTPPDNIYSLSGRDDKYPSLEREPPYHPNCSKYLMMYFGD